MHCQTCIYFIKKLVQDFCVILWHRMGGYSLSCHQIQSSLILPTFQVVTKNQGVFFLRDAKWAMPGFFYLFLSFLQIENIK